jgi:hypothetical protein
MHQQVRLKTTKPGSGSPGPGAVYDDSGSLLDVLTRLRDAGVNLQAAGGRDLDTDGELVFSVHHDGKHDADSATNLLKGAGYDARRVDVHYCNVQNEPGGLLGCIEELEATGERVYEIFVGTPERDGGIPVQLTTRAVIGGTAAG